MDTRVIDSLNSAVTVLAHKANTAPVIYDAMYGKDC